MINVVLSRCCTGKLNGFTVDGHAAYAPKGEDIICAAVSVLAQAAVLGLTEHLGLRPDVEIRDGYLRCILSPGSADSPGVQAILKTLELALKDIATGYPNRIRCKEVQT
ncbi:MAG: ribosomal-processing cysteine protease Prp [bacterium]|jgi:uncharacterized protein YsxB (DUF464 family)